MCHDAFWLEGNKRLWLLPHGAVGVILASARGRWLLFDRLVWSLRYVLERRGETLPHRQNFMATIEHHFSIDDDDATRSDQPEGGEGDTCPRGLACTRAAQSDMWRRQMKGGEMPHPAQALMLTVLPSTNNPHGYINSLKPGSGWAADGSKY